MDAASQPNSGKARRQRNKAESGSPSSNNSKGKERRPISPRDNTPIVIEGKTIDKDAVIQASKSKPTPRLVGNNANTTPRPINNSITPRLVSNAATPRLVNSSNSPRIATTPRLVNSSPRSNIASEDLPIKVQQASPRIIPPVVDLKTDTDKAIETLHTIDLREISPRYPPIVLSNSRVSSRRTPIISMELPKTPVRSSDRTSNSIHASPVRSSVQTVDTVRSVASSTRVTPDIGNDIRSAGERLNAVVAAVTANAATAAPSRPLTDPSSDKRYRLSANSRNIDLLPNTPRVGILPNIPLRQTKNDDGRRLTAPPAQEGEEYMDIDLNSTRPGQIRDDEFYFALDRLNINDQMIIREQYRKKMDSLREGHKMLDIPMLKDEEPVSLIVKRYDTLVRSILASSKATWYRHWLVIYWLGLEAVVSKMLKLNGDGFTLYMSKSLAEYDQLLIELGEKYLDSQVNGWPIEARIFVYGLMQMTLFVVATTASKYVGVDFNKIIEYIMSYITPKDIKVDLGNAPNYTADNVAAGMGTMGLRAFGGPNNAAATNNTKKDDDFHLRFEE